MSFMSICKQLIRHVLHVNNLLIFLLPIFQHIHTYVYVHHYYYIKPNTTQTQHAWGRKNIPIRDCELCICAKIYGFNKLIKPTFFPENRLSNNQCSSQLCEMTTFFFTYKFECKFSLLLFKSLLLHVYKSLSSTVVSVVISVG